jgi:GntR family transcriptional regulator
MNVNPQDFTLDFRSGVPVYVQLVEQVLQYLSNGSLKPGDQLPTVRQMAA